MDVSENKLLNTLYVAMQTRQHIFRSNCWMLLAAR
jgi:hypothetical protein